MATIQGLKRQVRKGLDAIFPHRGVVAEYIAGSWRGHKRVRGPHLDVSIQNHAPVSLNQQQQAHALLDRLWGKLKPWKRQNPSRCMFQGDIPECHIRFDFADNGK